ncbi:VOC family protein, partial [Quadrisphaera oryzae]
MKITEVTLPVDDLAAAERFYGSTLGLPTRPGGDALVVAVGSTELRLVEQVPSSGAVDHLAITVPADGFDEAKRWLGQRLDLLALDGRDEFEGAPSWDSRSLYFLGPSRCVLELITRRRVPARLGGDQFGPQHLLCVSEVGVAVPDVPAAARLLQAAAGLEVFGDGVGDTFAAVGDDDGLLVLAAEGRTWFPTADLCATASPRTVVATTDRTTHGPVELQLGSTSL